MGYFSHENTNNAVGRNTNQGAIIRQTPGDLGFDNIVRMGQNSLSERLVGNVAEYTVQHQNGLPGIRDSARFHFEDRQHYNTLTELIFKRQEEFDSRNFSRYTFPTNVSLLSRNTAAHT